MAFLKILHRIVGMMEFRDFIGKSLNDLIDERKSKSSDLIDNAQYQSLLSDKNRIETLADLTISVKEIIKAKVELLNIIKRIFELNVIQDSEKLDSAKKIESDLFTIISNLNIDLELVDSGSSDEAMLLQSLGVAYYVYEEFLYPVIATKSKDRLQTPDQWVDSQRKEFNRIKASLRSDLEMAELFGKNLNATERSVYGPRWNEVIRPLLSLANEQISAFPTEVIYSNWKTELMDNYKKVIQEWNLEEITQKTKEDVELMEIEDVVDEIIRMEIPFYDPNYASQENDEYKVALVEKIRRLQFDKKTQQWVGLGWDTKEIITGDASGDEDYEQTCNNLQRRELVVKLQMAALEGLQNRRNGFAEGDRSKLFESLIKAQLNREQLMLATTCHPRYGAYLTGILKIAQELPILRGGKLPNEANNATIFPLTFSVKGKDYVLNRKEQFQRTGKNTIDDRVVLRKSKNGLLPVLLRGDIYWETKDPDDESIVIESGYIPAEEGLPEDILLYEYSEKYNYESLASDTGRSTLGRMITDIMKMIDENPKKFGLSENDIPDDADKAKANFFAKKLFYSFPFLSYILAKRKEETQTDSHNTDLEESINWMLVYSPLGHAIHSSQRYGAANVAWMWLLPYYPELKSGHYGASGDAERLNKLRRLMILHQECFFDTSAFAGQIFKKEEGDDVLLPPFGVSEFLSPLDIITPSPQEKVALKGNGVGRKGEILSASSSRPVYLGFNGEICSASDGKKGVSILRSFELCKTAIDGWLEFLKRTLDVMSEELELDDIVEGEGTKKGIVGQLMGDCLGKAKMFFSEKNEWKGTELERFDHLYGVARPILWHLIERIFYAYRYTDINSRRVLFAKVLEAIDHNMSKGGLSSSSSSRMAASMFKTMSGSGKDRRYGVMGGFEGMNVSLAPPDESSWGKRRENVFNYLKALWEWERETSKEGVYVYGEFPLLNSFGILKPSVAISQKLNPQTHIAYYQQMMRKEVELRRPVTRNGLKTSSSVEDKK